MSFKTSVAVFLAIMSAGVAAYKVSYDGWYPVAVVNFHIISAQALEQGVATASGYLHIQYQMSGVDPAKLDTPDSSRELRREVLDYLISHELILQELNRRIGMSQTDVIAEKNITQELENNPNAAAGAEKLYGLTLAEFKDKVLLPQAYQDILQGRMQLNNEDFPAWLTNARKAGSVVIFYPGFSWDGTQVAAK